MKGSDCQDRQINRDWSHLKKLYQIILLDIEIILLITLLGCVWISKLIIRGEGTSAVQS